MNPNKTFPQRVRYFKYIAKQNLARHKKLAQQHVDNGVDANYYAYVYAHELTIFARAMGVSEKYLERYI